MRATISAKLLERFTKNDLVLEIETGAVGGEEDDLVGDKSARLYTLVSRLSGQTAFIDAGVLRFQPGQTRDLSQVGNCDFLEKVRFRSHKATARNDQDSDFLNSFDGDDWL